MKTHSNRIEINRYFIFITLFLLASTCEFCLAFEQTKNKPLLKLYWENTSPLNNDWLYLEKDLETIPSTDSNYSSITLPHTWNSIDVLNTKDYRRSGSWYRKHLFLTSKQLKDRTYLRFGAASKQAKVYLNGTLLTHHVGGYSAFTCELTETAIVGDNIVDVWVANYDNDEIVPLSGDFNVYGGIYRSVQFINAPQISIDRKHLGGPGFKVWSENVSADESDVKVAVRIDNGSTTNQKLSIKVSLFSPSGEMISHKSQKLFVCSQTISESKIELPRVVRPELWSPESPQLYTVKVEVMDGKTCIDKVDTSYGFRWFEFTADKGFLLNGESYKLKGISRHQDYYKKGSAVSNEIHYHDVLAMKEAGINWLRLAHYQQDDYMLQLCDELGILVWEEVPYVGKTRPVPAFEQNLHSMINDMVAQHYNHPAIILWGMGNEVWMKDRGDGKAHNYDLIKGMNDLIHSLDPVRKTVFVNGDRNYASELGVVQIPDVFGYNLYRGWYKENYKSLSARLLELHKLDPNKPLILSEFGAGSDSRIHSDHPQMQDFSVEYQNTYIASQIEQASQLEWLSGTNYWVFANFGAAHRGDSKPHINQKGLFTFDRKKKDAFYLIKSLYSSEPMVYLESPSWNKRGGDATKQYRAFSNMTTVELFQNGVSLGVKEHPFVWDVTLSEGDNTLKVIGKKGSTKREHKFTVHYKASLSNFLVTANKQQEDHKAEYAVDNDLTTYWSAPAPSEFQLDMTKICLVNGVKIAFQTPGKYHYSVEGSKDGKTWVSLFDGQSNMWAPMETVLFDKQQEIQYLKVIGAKSDKNSFNAYSEIVPLITFEKAEKNIYELDGVGMN